MNKDLNRLAINLLDTQEGISLQTFDFLKSCLIQGGDSDSKDIIENVTVISNRVFLDEDWVELNSDRFMSNS